MRAIALLMLILCAAGAPAAAAEPQQPARTVTVTGTGTSSVVPDRAEVLAGVQTQAETAGAALATNNEAVRRLFRTLAEHGVAERDHQTRNLHVGPVYEQPSPTRGGAPRVVAYQVTNQVRIVVRDLARLGGLLDALVKTGANRLDGVRFVVSDPAAATDQARKAAVDDAKRRAALYVEALGARLGKVMQISEAGIHLPRPEFMQAATARSLAADVPIATGENEISANIAVTFAIE